MRFIEDTRWETLRSAYRSTYDPRGVLRQLAERPSEAAWNELWNELHHQGDVDDASYAAVPVLAEIHRNSRSLGWNCYALCATIEIERHRKANPPLPAWVKSEYEIRSAMSVVAIAKGMLGLGALIGSLDDSELQEILDERLGWSDLYNAD
jgi:hypothetical protein